MTFSVSLYPPLYYKYYRRNPQELWGFRFKIRIMCVYATLWRALYIALWRYFGGWWLVSCVGGELVSYEWRVSGEERVFWHWPPAPALTTIMWGHTGVSLPIVTPVTGGDTQHEEYHGHQSPVWHNTSHNLLTPIIHKYGRCIIYSFTIFYFVNIYKQLFYQRTFSWKSLRKVIMSVAVIPEPPRVIEKL